MLWRRSEREMRSYKRDEQNPWFVLVLLCFLAQPDLCLCRNCTVIGGVGGLSRSCRSRQLFGMAPGCNGIAQQADQVTLLVDHVHGKYFFAEPVVFVGAAKVKFPD